MTGIYIFGGLFVALLVGIIVFALKGGRKPAPRAATTTEKPQK